MILDPLNVSLFISILLSSLVAGLLFGFAVVVMPGLAKITDKDFLSPSSTLMELYRTTNLCSLWSGQGQSSQPSQHWPWE